jgi:hypothetical protein
MVYGTPYPGVDYNLTLCPLQSRLKHIYRGHQWGNSMPESTLTLCQSRLYTPVRDFKFGLWPHTFHEAPLVTSQTQGQQVEEGFEF